MSYSGYSGHGNSAVLDHVEYIRIDDETHYLVLSGRPQEAEPRVGLEQCNRCAAQAEADRDPSERWRDVRDARRSVRG